MGITRDLKTIGNAISLESYSGWLEEFTQKEILAEDLKPIFEPNTLNSDLDGLLKRDPLEAAKSLDRNKERRRITEIVKQDFLKRQSQVLPFYIEAMKKGLEVLFPEKIIVSEEAKEEYYNYLIFRGIESYGIPFFPRAGKKSHLGTIEIGWDFYSDKRPIYYTNPDLNLELRFRVIQLNPLKYHRKLTIPHRYSQEFLCIHNMISPFFQMRFEPAIARIWSSENIQL